MKQQDLFKKSLVCLIAITVLTMGMSLVATAAPVKAVMVKSTDTSKPAAPVAQEGISVTEVRKEKSGKYSATLNGAIVIKEIEIKKNEKGDDKLFFPQTPGKGDKKYQVIYLEDRSIADQIKKAALDGKATGKGTPAGLKITEVIWHSFESKSKVLGAADVTFNDAITVKGCKLIESNDGGYWVGWPSVKVGKEYDDLVFSLDKGVKEAVQAAIEKEAGIKKK